MSLSASQDQQEGNQTQETGERPPYVLPTCPSATTEAAWAEETLHDLLRQPGQEAGCQGMATGVNPEILPCVIIIVPVTTTTIIIITAANAMPGSAF